MIQTGGYIVTKDGQWLKLSDIWEVEKMYQLLSKKRGAEQLHCYWTADLRLCFTGEKFRNSDDMSNLKHLLSKSMYKQNIEASISGS